MSTTMTQTQTFSRTTGWEAQAECRDENPELFFDYDPQAERTAKAICSTCTVREECLEYAMDNNIEGGIWGGLDEQERRTLRRNRRKQTEALVSYAS